jgi:fatty acid desaturase
MELEFSGRSTAAAATRVVEWPTMAVVGGVFGSYGALTWFHRSIPTWLLIPLLGFVITWHSSLQHEIIHGHPTKWARLNRLIGRTSFDLFTPFEHYSRTHLLHHRDQYLTDPTVDGESFYVTAEKWASTGPFMRRVLSAHQTLVGRLLLSPFLTLIGYVGDQMLQVVTLDHPDAEGCPRRRWLGHLPFVAVTVAWLAFVDFPPLTYFFCICIAISGIRLRSFAEHRWTPDGRPRTAMVHAAPPLALLFLNNNLHVAHHARMTVPWYQLPRLAQTIDADELARQGAGVYSGYLDVARQYGVHMIYPTVYPGVPLNPDAQHC